MKRSCFTVAAALAAVLVPAALAGCGGGAGTAAPAADLAPPPAQGTSFNADLISLVRNAQESAEPADVDGVMPSTPEGDEPVAVE